MKRVLKVTGIVIATVVTVAFLGFVRLCVALGREDKARYDY